MDLDKNIESSDRLEQDLFCKLRNFKQGAVDILPLSVAVLPWGILAGSVSINAGLSFLQAFAMSGLMYAGAAQLVSLGLIMSNASILTMILTVFFVSSQHLMYALNLRPEVQNYTLGKRLCIGFLLTDELFATAMAKKSAWSYMYLLGAGLSFYLAWCVFSLMGILLAKTISNLDHLHLDFSIVAVFIFIIVPMIKDRTSWIAVAITIILSCAFKYIGLQAAVLLAALGGMLYAVFTESSGA